MKNQKENRMVSKKEMIGYAFGGFGQNLVFGLWNGYIMMFYTDVFLLPQAFIAALFLGARIWDGFNDPMMGMVADRTRTKWGKFRPWFLFIPIPIAVLLFLSFLAPEVNVVMKMVYAGVTYVLLGMAFTATDIPFWGLPSAMSASSRERTHLFSVARMATNLASLATGVLVVPMLNLFGHGDMKQGFVWTALLIALTACLCHTINFLLVREHVEPQSEKVNLRTGFKTIIQNKPLLLVMTANLIFMTIYHVRSSMQIYYAQYNLGSMKLVSLISLSMVPGLIIGSAMIPKIAERLGKRKSLMTCYIVFGCFCIVQFVLGYQASLPVILLMIAFSAFPGSMIMVLTSSMTSDTIEFAQWKFNQRNEGMISSTQTLVTKISMALAGAIAAGSLMLVQYVPNVPQSAQTLQMFHSVYSLLPAIAACIACIPIYFYDLSEEKHENILKELAQRKESEKSYHDGI